MRFALALAAISAQADIGNIQLYSQRRLQHRLPFLHFSLHLRSIRRLENDIHHSRSMHRMAANEKGENGILKLFSFIVRNLTKL